MAFPKPSWLKRFFALWEKIYVCGVHEQCWTICRFVSMNVVHNPPISSTSKPCAMSGHSKKINIYVLAVERYLMKHHKSIFDSDSLTCIAWSARIPSYQIRNARSCGNTFCSLMLRPMETMAFAFCYGRELHFNHWGRWRYCRLWGRRCLGRFLRPRSSTYSSTYHQHTL